MNPPLFTAAALKAVRQLHGSELMIWLPSSICPALIQGAHALAEPIDIHPFDTKLYGRDFTVIPDACLAPESGLAMVKSATTRERTPFDYRSFVPHGTFRREWPGVWIQDEADMEATAIATVLRLQAAHHAHQGITLSPAELASIVLHLKP